MRVSKKSELNLTPLLDVILILLFVFMIMLANQQQDMARQAEDYEEQSKSINEEIGLLTDENQTLVNDKAGLEDELDKLVAENERLIGENETLQDENEQVKAQMEMQEATITEAAKALAEFTEASESEIKAKLTNGETINAETIEEITNSTTITESLIKYSALSQEFYFVEVELKTKHNRIYINDKATSSGVSMDEIEDKDGKDSKVDEIAGVIEEALDDRKGGAEMTFIILKVHDSAVYHKAWEVVWEATGEVQKKYGTENVFRTHITLIN